MKRAVAFILIGGFIVAWFALSAGFFQAAPPRAYGAEAKFKFGAALALTGPFAREGTNLKKAYDFWADAVNAKGGIEVAGKKYLVEVVYYDDKSEPKTATRLTEKLITEDKVDLILGPFSSSIVGPASTITEKYKVPMIEAAGNAAPLFNRGFKYLFTTLRPAVELADPYFRLFKRLKPKPEKIAIIAPEHPFMLSAAQGFKDYAEKQGFQVVHYETFPTELADLTPILQKVKAKNPDILMVGSHTVVAMNVMRQSKQMDFNPKLFAFSYGVSVPEFAKEMGKDGDYVIDYTYMSETAPFSDHVFGSSRDFMEAYKRKVGIRPDAVATSAVAAGMTFEAAIKAAGVKPPLSEADRVKVRDAISKLDIKTAAGPVKFDAVGFNVANPLAIDQLQGGKPVTVEPEEWATAKMVYPVPPWGKR